MQQVDQDLDEISLLQNEELSTGRWSISWRDIESFVELQNFTAFTQSLKWNNLNMRMGFCLNKVITCNSVEGNKEFGELWMSISDYHMVNKLQFHLLKALINE